MIKEQGIVLYSTTMSNLLLIFSRFSGDWWQVWDMRQRNTRAMGRMRATCLALYARLALAFACLKNAKTIRPVLQANVLWSEKWWKMKKMVEK